MKNNSCFRKLFKFDIFRQWSIFLLIGLFVVSPLYPQLPSASEVAAEMTIGWNIGNSLEVPTGETGWGNPKISQELIDSVYNAGFNTIRIPCAWDNHADQITLKIDEDWLARVKEVVDYCYNNDMFVILNCHWDGGWLENNVTAAMKDSVNKKQAAYWTQIADYFKDYDEHLLFASANEPNVSNSSQMSVLLSYHQTFIDAVRATGGNNSSRVLVIQGPSTDIDKTYSLMNTMPEDSIENRLIVEIHYYTPWNFCGLEKDETWGDMFYFWGEDYHSETNTGRNANWGEESAVETYFQKMKTKFIDKGIPVLMGEYSVIKRTSLTGDDLDLHIASREYYYKYVTNSAIRHGLIPVYWDNGWNGNNGLALFNRNTGAVVDSGALAALMEGTIINTSVEEQQELQKTSAVDFISTSPNPVSTSAEIQLILKKASRVHITIVNVLGQEVALFKDLNFGQGTNSVTWNAAKLPTGIYFIKVNIGNDVLTRKILVRH